MEKQGQIKQNSSRKFEAMFNRSRPQSLDRGQQEIGFLILKALGAMRRIEGRPPLRGLNKSLGFDVVVKLAGCYGN